jgi:hypothetical protein
MTGLGTNKSQNKRSDAVSHLGKFLFDVKRNTMVGAWLEDAYLYKTYAHKSQKLAFCEGYSRRSRVHKPRRFPNRKSPGCLFSERGKAWRAIRWSSDRFAGLVAP